MSTDSEREIRGRLDAALGTITPPSLPADAIRRQGRTIRMRRRAAVAAGLAAVVGLGVALPGLVAHVNTAPPVKHSYRVTVNPTRDTPSKLVFSGSINGQAWRFELDWDKGQIMQQGPSEAEDNLGDIPLDGQPGWFDEAGLGSGPNAQLQLAGRVGLDVTRLAFNEPGGRTIYVTPARWHGERWAGVGIPARQRLRSVVAYTARGELAYAIPFTDNSINVWLKPGQHGLARQRARIAAGVFDGKRWWFEGHAGPWGICMRTSVGNGGDCLQAYGSRLAPGHFVTWLSCGPWDGPASQFWSGQAAADVSYLKFRLSDGSRLRVVPVALAGYHYFALVFGGHQSLAGWAAYGAAGQTLGSGSVAQNC